MATKAKKPKEKYKPNTFVGVGTLSN